ncbi:MAG: signal peptidase I [Firmicutes bacterium]|nr:signal peptidase I [Bacillota bacterium]
MATLNKLLKAVSTILVILMVIIAMLMVGVRLFGLQVYTVLSGSMEPEYPVGSMVYVMEADTATLELRDVITFRLSEETVVTHRIIDIIHDENNPQKVSFQTQGDSNNVADGTLVEPDDIIGKVVFKIPYMGYLAMFLGTRQGRLAAIAACAAMLLVTLMSELLNAALKEKQGKQPAKEVIESENKE